MKIFVIGESLDSYPRNKNFLEVLSRIYKIEKYFINRRKILNLDNFKFLFKKCDYFFVMFPCQKIIFLACIYKIFHPRTIIVIDFFISNYDTLVSDRNIIKKMSLKALYLYFIDWLSILVADLLMFDTEDDRDYFLSLFKLNKNNFIVPVFFNFNNNIKSAFKLNKESGEFSILFYGGYSPLHGIDIIIRSALLLSNKYKQIKFYLIGSGQLKDEMINLNNELGGKNINFIDGLNYDDLLSAINDADLCLGIFGETEKAKRVIPNKLIDYLALGKLVVTGETLATKKFFNNGVDLIYCRIGDYIDLANKIESVVVNYSNFNSLGSNGQKKVLNFFSDDYLYLLMKEKIKI